MKKPCFRVTSDPSRWIFWKSSHILARITSKFDDLNHPYGQWTVRLTRVETDVEASPWRLDLEFLVDAAPWQLIQPGMVLPCFYGARRLADLVVQED